MALEVCSFEGPLNSRSGNPLPVLWIDASRGPAVDWHGHLCLPDLSLENYKYRAPPSFFSSFLLLHNFLQERKLN